MNEVAQSHITAINHAIGEVVDDVTNADIVITADQGMSVKERVTDPAAILSRHGVETEFVPVI